jgi:replicative DNA helicase
MTIHPFSSTTRSKVHTERASEAQSARDALAALRTEEPGLAVKRAAPIGLGFDLLDRLLEGGLHNHDLMLLGGSPGIGKTIAALQMARHMAAEGRTAVYVSYEHDTPTMLGRLLSMELGSLSQPHLDPELDRLRRVVVDATAGYRSFEEVLHSEPLIAQAVERLDTYADRLLLVRGSGAHTTLAELAAVIENLPEQDASVMFVDYLQKVAVHPEPAEEAEKITRVSEGLKDLALEHDLAVVALVAADWDGLRAGRTRLHHLRGSSALAYECDVAVLLNDKHRSVAKNHLAYDTVKAESYKQQVIFSLEKNRGGPAMVDIEYRKDFEHYRFVPEGRYVVERLVDDRLEAE